MKHQATLFICVVLYGYLTSFIQAQVGLQAQCALLGVGSFIISDQILCEEEKEDEKFDLATALCRSRPFDNKENCLRCIQKREDQEECDNDLGNNGVDDDIESLENDDCEYDGEFDYCLDEFPEGELDAES